MPTTSKWSSPVEVVAINSDATSPTLKNCSDNNSITSGAIDNTSNRYQYCDVELWFKPQANYSGASRVEIYILTAPDGTNYTTISQVSLLKVVATPGTGTDLIRYVIPLIHCPPHLFKIVVVNKLGQQMTDTDDENGCVLWLYSDEMVLDD